MAAAGEGSSVRSTFERMEKLSWVGWFPRGGGALQCSYCSSERRKGTFKVRLFCILLQHSRYVPSARTLLSTHAKYWRLPSPLPSCRVYRSPKGPEKRSGGSHGGLSKGGRGSGPLQKETPNHPSSLPPPPPPPSAGGRQISIFKLSGEGRGGGVGETKHGEEKRGEEGEESKEG